MSKTVAKAQTVAAEVAAIMSEPVLTVADVRKGGIDAKATLQEIRRREHVITALGTPVMTDKALHVFYVTTTKGLIGPDGEWSKQGDYAADAGLSGAYVTRLKRLGRAMVEFGVKQGDKRYTFLASKGDTKPVGEVFSAVDGLPDTATAKERRDLFNKGMEAAMTPAVESADKREARPNDGADQTGEESGNGEETATREVTMADVLALVDRFAKDADREEWAAMENRLNAIITRENTIRSKATASK